MSSRTRTQYRPVLMDVNTTYVSGGREMGGFIAKTAGTITVNSTDPTTVLLLNAIPVAAGEVKWFPILIENGQGFTVVLGGGASGTLMV